ncbi:class I SAM-dependent methyltransferase [Rhodococcus fascians]|nr:class I SAM-dependent methyltransferase [Rhodococcus fascians]MBY4418868.1 class I SAM-dependent methyltransferase [Rhodococcus fascians]
MQTTLASYETAAELYVQRTERGSTPAWQSFADQFVAKVPAGKILELGSGPGWHAAQLESKGLHVERSDGADAFVRMMAADGHAARKLDVVTDQYGGPYDGIFANAVLLHLNSQEFLSAVGKAAKALRSGGVFAFTLKEGDGEEWSDAKLNLPRYFKYWRERDVRSSFDVAEWATVSIRSEIGRGRQPWLLVLADRA